ncbi:hypothetical protein OG871_13225 [Kitasatospora sp. NBC_00374]|uniref:hypothetical protein n=1 Tax=Kitasatospora sp. NBC_00374 TaxID=2975964 RepID=UPI0032436EFD
MTGGTGGRRRGVTHRALRTAAVLTLILATAAGAALSTGPGPVPARVSAAQSASPQIPVDPLGAPVGIDPASGAATGAAAGTAPGTAAGSTPAGAAPAAVSAAAAPADGPSAVTVGGTGEFAGLEVTVGQTTHLVNQVVTVVWKGGRPTQPSPMVFGQNYLTFMQCWGDAESGPDRDQCQYGASKGDNRGGDFVPSRQLNPGRTLVDPAEPIKPTQPNQNVFAPFRSFDGSPVETGGSSQFFSLQSTNEVPYAPTRADGTGQVFFEIQTGSEAAGLGCGNTPKGESGPFTEGRRCWLVVVPRGSTEVDGSTLTNPAARLQSSPLSASNWAHRLVVPLRFEPVGLSCPLGSSELATSGTEFAAEMIWRWQPALCRRAGRIFNFGQATDDMARLRLTRDRPGLLFMGAPLAAADQAEGRTPVYAPLAVSGLTLAFDIESQSNSLTPPETARRDGQRIQEMNLTPRLVAKLLTQSYRFAVNPGDPRVPAGNPRDLVTDPEFLDINPQFRSLAFPSGIADLLVPSADGDLALAVWRWVLADPDAKAFVEGQVSPAWHDSVNTAFLADDKAQPPVPRQELPVPGYPKPDGYCKQFDAELQRPEWCNLDGHPYANNMAEGARAAARGDTLARSEWDPSAIPGSLKKANPQAQGLRGVLALTTTAQAARYGLSTARLRNGAGEFVAPTEPSMLAAANAAVPGAVPDAKVVDPAAKAAGGYPLTTVTYAATVPSAISAADGRAYAELLRYAVTEGQRPGIAVGELPAGYVPLPEAMRARTTAVAQTIEERAGRPESQPEEPAAEPGTTPRAVPRAAAPAAGGDAQEPVAPQTPAPGHSVVTLAPSPPAAPVARTARTDVGGLRYLLLGTLIAGLLAGAAGIVVPRLLRRRRP